MKNLTERQEAILGFIVEFLNEHGYPPTFREIGAQFSILPKAARAHVTALVKKGMLKVRDHSSRSIEVLVDEPADFRDIPIVGEVAAGKPIMSEENVNETLRVHSSMLKDSAAYFAMKVRGDSMTGAGILHGDIVLIEKKETADNGQIVVAVTGEAVTLKRFFRDHSRIRLQAENPAYQPIFTTEAHIVGVLTLSMRRY